MRNGGEENGGEDGVGTWQKSWLCKDDGIQHCVCVYKVSGASKGMTAAQALRGRYREGMDRMWFK